MFYKFIFTIISFFITELSAQIIGTVLNRSDGNPIVAANVIADVNGTSTDSLGNFSIDVPVGTKLKISQECN